MSELVTKKIEHDGPLTDEQMQNAQPVPMPTVPLQKTLSQKTVKHLIKLAERSAFEDRDAEDCDYYSHYGGNMDDAFYGGLSEGETLLARDLLHELCVNYEVEE